MCICALKTLGVIDTSVEDKSNILDGTEQYFSIDKCQKY